MIILPAQSLEDWADLPPPSGNELTPYRCQLVRQKSTYWSIFAEKKIQKEEKFSKFFKSLKK